MVKDNSYLGRPLEVLFLFFIVLVILHTLAEELAVLLDLPVDIRTLLLIVGFGFDVLFTFEFITRLVVAGKNRGAGAYMTREGGTIDFLSSIPLLVLSSGPLLYMTFFAGEGGLIIAIGSFSFLKIVKIMRVVRTLRFIRVLKLFGKTKTPRVMTTRYVSLALILAISTQVAALAGFTLFENGRYIRPQALKTSEILQRELGAIEPGQENDNGPAVQQFVPLIRGDRSVLFVRYRDDVVFTNIKQATFSEQYMGSDFFTERISGYQFFFNNKDVKKAYALIHLLVFSGVILNVVAIATVFRSAFNRHVTGVLSMMIRGFRRSRDTTPVRIPGRKRLFETYRLAEQYNRKWLPVKERIRKIKERTT
jgi:hypothetical protein